MVHAETGVSWTGAAQKNYNEPSPGESRRLPWRSDVLDSRGLESRDLYPGKGLSEKRVLNQVRAVRTDI